MSNDDVSDYARWKGWDPTRFGTVKARDANYFAWHVARAVGRDRRGMNVLEIGFGNGTFLGWVRREGHRIAGTEIDASLVELARKAGFEAAASPEALDGAAPWDLIVGFDVLEHVPPEAAAAFIGGLAQRLAPDGRMLFRFPNGESPFGLIRQHRDATHVHVLGVSRMRQIAAPLGLRVAHSGDALPWHARRWRSVPTALLGALVRAALEWTLGRLYMGRAPNLQANEVVVLEKVQPQRQHRSH
jgi:2-polyprenyl-3-methyl-5-hydroxy-6-metoxy-1,4-benzoquinol methylase